MVAVGPFLQRDGVWYVLESKAGEVSANSMRYQFFSDRKLYVRVCDAPKVREAFATR